MLPGPNYVYRCPNCGNIIQRGSLMSGNTGSEKVYSDGKRIAPMLPEFPNLTKCKKCETFLWLSKLKEIGTYNYDDNANVEWQNADIAEFLGVEDYFSALSKGVAENKGEALFIRHRIWWAYNDRIRNGEDLFKVETDELRWTENLKKLKAMLDPSDINHKIMIAEIHRNLGEFERCVNIIKSIDDEALFTLKDAFISECNRRNKMVFEINY